MKTKFKWLRDHKFSQFRVVRGFGWVALCLVILTSSLSAALFDKLKGAGGKDFDWKAKQIFDAQPKILAARNRAIGFKGSDINDVAESDPRIDQMLAKEAKLLTAHFAKKYPLKKARFNDALKEWPKRTALNLLRGELPEYTIPESVTEDYVMLFSVRGVYGCVANDKTNSVGQPLGDLDAVVTLKLTLIDAKTKLMLGQREISEGRQKINDVLLDLCRGVIDKPNNAGLTPTKAYQEAFSAGKTGVERFIYDMKGAKPPG